MKSQNFTYHVMLALIMALLPFGETPHLWQKLLLLNDGYLHPLFLDGAEKSG